MMWYLVKQGATLPLPIGACQMPLQGLRFKMNILYLGM